jgi:hypothetical protein
MVASRHGVLIYGGAHWTETNLDKSDAISAAKEKYLEKC